MAKDNQMKAVIFDSGALISLSMNGLLDVVKNLKKGFNGNFIITKEVKEELVDYPIKRKQFELEALRIRGLLEEGILELPDKIGLDNKIIQNKTEEIMNMTNEIFVSHKKSLNIFHNGEASCLALSKLLTERGIENVIAVDERTTRILIEKPQNLKDLLERKLHTRIELKKNSFEYFKDFRVIRSAEILYVAWKRNLVDIKDGDLVLDALLYAVKFKGCAISSDEIEEIKSLK